MNNQIEVLITLPFTNELVEPLQHISAQLHISLQHARNPDDIPDEIWEKVEILYTNKVLPIPEKVPNLGWIQFHWAGIDSLLEAPILRKPGLVFTTLSGTAVSQMAEYIVMMLLALGHRLPDLITHQRRTEWAMDRWERFTPLELRGSTVGIVGYGSIGRQVARLLHPFGVTVLATKRDAMNPIDRGYIPEGMGDSGGDFVHRLYPPEALCSMIKECDFVVVTVPLTAETQGLIGVEEIAAMKPTSFLIDVSRGGIVQHKALIPALREQRLAGAALDVFPAEPLLEDSHLWKLSNTLVTPHISGGTTSYDQRAMELFAENLERYISGDPLYNLFDYNIGY